MKKLCGECALHDSKYKCPTCEMPYCSVACFRVHQGREVPCEPRLGRNPPALGNEWETRNGTMKKSTKKTKIMSGTCPAAWILSVEQCAALAGSPELMDLLMTHPHRDRLVLRLKELAMCSRPTDEDDREREREREVGLARRDALFDAWLKEDEVFRHFVDVVMKLTWPTPS